MVLNPHDNDGVGISVEVFVSLQTLVKSYEKAWTTWETIYAEINPYGGPEGREWYEDYTKRQDNIWKEIRRIRKEMFEYKEKENA